MAERPVSRNVDLLLVFTNSVDHELDTDDLTSTAELSQWLVDHGLMARRIRATAEDLALARELRDAVHDALVANHEGSPRGTALSSVGERLPLRLTVGSSGPVLRPVLDGVRGALSEVLIAVNASVGDGTWPRLNICASDECEWAYFDSSKNRSRSWCEWGCGNKIKTRNYRARQKASG